MNDISVRVVDLRLKVAENRSQHRKIFEEAVEGYHEQAIALLESHIAEIKSGKITVVAVHLPAPEDHTTDYDRVLAMLDMTVDSEIVLDENDFASYVMDDWSWKKHFLQTNSAYSATARSSL